MMIVSNDDDAIKRSHLIVRATLPLHVLMIADDNDVIGILILIAYV